MRAYPEMDKPPHEDATVLFHEDFLSRTMTRLLRKVGEGESITTTNGAESSVGFAALGACMTRVWHQIGANVVTDVPHPLHRY